MKYTDPYDNKNKYIPYCIEPSLGVDRLMLAMLLDAYKEEELEDGSERVVLQLHPSVAAYKAAVFPLTKKLNEEAEEVFHELSKYFNVDYDDSGSIGKRYRRHDEIGTPFCITYDFDSLDDKCVTVRDRDTMEQKRVKIDELKEYIENIIKL
jgi:glycyl-tRNA synthetase